MAMTFPLGRLSVGSSATKPGASPDASDQSPAAGAPLSFFFFFPGSASTWASLLELTTDQPPAEVDDAAATGAAGVTVSAGARGSDGLGAGVHEGSLGGIGVGSGAGRKGAAGAGVKGSGGAAG